MAWVALFVIGVVAVVWVHMWFKMRHVLERDEATFPHTFGPITSTKEAHMATHATESGRLQAYRPDPIMPVPFAGDGAPPPMSSINDVHLLRAQDQAIAQLAAQYEDMARDPWRVEPLAADGWNAPVPTTRIRALSLMLTELMNPPANTGSQRGNSARGTLVWVNVGNQKVSADGQKAAHVLHETLNAAYFDTVGKHKARLLADLIACASADGVSDWAKDTVVFSVQCGQTRVLLASQNEAETLCAALNGAFKPAFDAERRRILDELAASAHG